ncbi:MAG: hypothetical protein ACT4PT_13950 [Methanobacteriota archaeon]
MSEWETKLKLGRKLEGVDAATASANQVSALFRYDEKGGEKHVSLSIESDAMKAEDVAAVFQLLHDRGILHGGRSKTWLNQPQAAIEKFGHTSEWGGSDLGQMLDLLKHGLRVRDAAPAAPLDARTALLLVGEVEKKLAELKASLSGP